ncbi:MAG: hypothetical protein IKK62_00495 [Bacteroidaceae bacterium]|nr:hypothetical protein [Bacteroidaceae bacterium]
MKSIIKKTALSLILASFAGGAVAQQTLNSAYFLDDFTYRHEMNPAYMGDSYFSFPVLGQLNMSTRGNVGLENFLFNTDRYGLTTFMNPDVSSSQFLNDLEDENNLSFSLKTSIFSMGFRGWGGYNTLGLNLHVHTGLNMPYGLFAFAKNGMQGDTHYSLDEFSVRARGYAELALGHSHRINRNLTVGAKLKVLFGGAAFDATVEDMDISMTQQQWMVRAHAKVNASMKGAYFTEDEDGLVDGMEVESPGLGGLGFGADLGATYQFDEGLLKGLTLSAAVLDLGFINWSDNVTAYNEGEDFVFDGFQDIAINSENGGRELEDQADDLVDDLEKLYNVHTDGKVGSRRTSLATTLNLGAEYVFPLYDKLKFGLLYSKRFDDVFSWQETRVSANVNPTRWFGAGVNYAFSTFGSSMGFVLNFHPKGINFFVGTDYMLSEVNSQFIPLNSNANVSMGVNIILGKNKH